jgi:hypothetical protein
MLCVPPSVDRMDEPSGPIRTIYENMWLGNRRKIDQDLPESDADPSALH